ncbi:hypothetical protein PAXINDRAFT_15062 [Paxillus involutus ATCC 200175]|uniref:MULE transposase domain-containing protein n=1 Tax=Paxillus involutus ATCC 200175 TaxID=664439 RepID=A0A0C9TWX9_PAXIN|nr:hypothetical protein PAXINDRAFT_15062 [Paxillus involutus ATCC 200175]
MFSPPDDVHGYADKSISHEMVTEIFLDFANRTRHVESETYLKTLRTRCSSMDSTFRASGKAVLTDANRQKSKELKGGILSVINEENEIVIVAVQRFCQTRANAKITELLEGLKRHHDALGVTPPEMIIADNCCQVRSAVKAVFPQTDACLDVWHFIARYDDSSFHSHARNLN